MSLSDILAEYEGKPGVEIRKQCGIPLTDEIICPEIAVGEVQVPLEDGMILDLPICEGHLTALSEMRRDLTIES
jgi:hypothetical protein